mgnify:CR=1 FL=1
MNTNKLSYIVKNICLAYELDESIIEQISFGNNKPKSVHIETAKDHLCKTPTEDIWNNKKILFLFDSDKKNLLLRKKMEQSTLTTIYSHQFITCLVENKN